MSWSIQVAGTRQAVIEHVEQHQLELPGENEQCDYEQAKQLIMDAVQRCPAGAVRVTANGNAHPPSDHHNGTSSLTLQVEGLPEFLV